MSLRPLTAALSGVGGDASFAARSLARVPVYTLTVLVTLALAIGGVTAVFSVLYAVVLRPLPFHDPDALVAVHTNFEAVGLHDIPLSPRELLDVGERAKSFRHLAGFAIGSVNMTGHGNAERVSAGFATSEYVDVLGAPPTLGRAFLAEDDDGAGAKVVLLSDRFHERLFGKSATAIGQPLELDGTTYTVVGVLPKEYARSIRGVADVGMVSNETVDVWLPLTFAPEQIDPRARGGRFITTIARLAPGVTVDQASNEMHALGVAFADESPGSYQRESGFHLSMRPLQAMAAGRGATVLRTLLGAVVLLLLAACANVVSLSLARLATRRREIAVRVAVGASDGQIVRQFLIESVLLAVTGGMAGLVVGHIGMDALLSSPLAGFAHGAEVTFNGPVLAFAFGVCIATGIVVGVVPALHASRLQPVEGMRDGGRSTGGNTARLRSALVVAQVAVALLLLVSAGSLLRNLVGLTRTSPGFDTRDVSTAQLSISYEKPEEQRRLLRDAVAQMQAIPGVEAAGFSSVLPLQGWADRTFEVEGAPRPAGVVKAVAQVRSVGGDYFGALGIRVVDGRTFRASDDEHAPDVAIVNRALVTQFMEGSDPLTKRLLVSLTPLGPKRAFTIVGVVDDTRDMGLDTRVHPFLYMSAPQAPVNGVGFVVRAPKLGAQALPAMRAAMTEADARQPLFGLQPFQNVVDESLGPQRFTLLLFGLFAALALLLAALGIYGITSYSVAQRTQEIAVRIAMGADDASILRLVVGHALRLIAIGLVLGGALAIGFGRVMASLMAGLTPSDPVALATIAGVLLVTGGVAGFLPARRASSLELANALRTE